MDLSNLEEQLEQLERHYQNQLPSLSQISANDNGQVDFMAPDFLKVWADSKEMWRKQILLFESCQSIYALFDQLCPTYLSASTSLQEQIRKAFTEKAGILGLLVGRIESSAYRLRASKNHKELLDGLAAASILNSRYDYRDILVALSELYVAAEEVGIDPKPHFQTVAMVSSNVPSLPDDYSTQRMLAEFHTFAALRDRKGEVTQEEKAAMEEMVKKAFDEQFKQIEQSTPPAPWWKRIFGSQ